MASSRFTFTAKGIDPFARILSSNVIGTVIKPPVVVPPVKIGNPNVIIKPDVIIKPNVVTQPETVISIKPMLVTDLIISNLKQYNAVPEELLTVPISPIPKATDEVFYRMQNDKKTKYYIPRYRIAKQMVTASGEQFKIKLEKLASGGAQLTVFLQKYPVANLQSEALNAKEIEHILELSIHYIVANGVTKVLHFQEVTFQTDEIKAVLKLSNLEELTQVYNAFTVRDYQLKLIVRRKATLAVPLYFPKSEKEINPSVDQPILVIKGQEEFLVNGKAYTRLFLSVRNRIVFPSELFKAAPHLPPCGTNTNAARSWVHIYTDSGKKMTTFCALKQNIDLAGLSFAFPKGELPGKNCYIEIEDRQTGKIYVSASIPLTSQFKTDSNLYQVSNEVMEFTEEMYFPAALHAYIYKGILPGASTDAGFKLFKEGNHCYLQDLTLPQRFLYFPDAFKLTRVDGIKRIPWLKVDFSMDNKQEVVADLDYRIAPYINVSRLENAAINLKNKTKLEADKSIDFEPFLLKMNQIEFRLVLPGDHIPTLRSNISVDMSGGITDSIAALSLEKLNTAFSKLLSTNPIENELTGQVQVKIENSDIIPIPVSIRFEDAIGELFDISKTTTSGQQNIVVALRNVIESPIRIESALVFIKTSNNLIPASIKGLSFPLNLNAAEQVQFEVIPAQTITNLEKSELLFNWQNLDILSTDELMYDVIVDPNVSASYKDSIMVHQQADAFTPGSAIRSIKIDFSNSKGGYSNTTDAPVFLPDGAQQKTVELRCSVRDFILSKTSSGPYWYRITMIRSAAGGGTESIEGEWQFQELGGDLLISSNILPGIIQ